MILKTRPVSAKGLRLSQTGELLYVDSELIQDAMEERRTDLAPPMYRNGHAASFRMSPAFVTPCLSCLYEPELRCDTPKLLCTSARHS
jgi:hypothetical protein